jgi:hypothetical protein
MNQLVLNESEKNPHPGCAELMTMAERELAAFFNAVTQMCGSAQAEISAEDWLRELQAVDGLPDSPREWRLITTRASTRIANRVNDFVILH